MFRYKIRQISYTLSLLATVIVTIIFYSCNNNPVVPIDSVFTFTAEEASCIEVWLEMKTNIDGRVNIFRNDSLLMQINTYAGTDTLIYDSNLLPSQNYTYRADFEFENKTYSRKVVIQTMDTSSHNYSWQTLEFGEIASSYLMDVAIINENNIWAVGCIFMKDSLGNPDPIPYNAIHWDGVKLEKYRFHFYVFCGQTYTGPYPASSTYLLNEDEVIISALSQLTWIKNGRQIKIECIPVSVDRIWVAARDNIYAVGAHGKIAHYNGTSWKNLVSGTDLRISSVIGTFRKNSPYLVYAAAEDALLKIEDPNVSRIPAGNQEWIYSIWAKSGNLIYTAGNGLILYRNEKWIRDESLNMVYFVKGEEHNNIAALGADYSLYHFNGFSWQKIYVNDVYMSLDIKDNIIAASGFRGDKAILTILKR